MSPRHPNGHHRALPDRDSDLELRLRAALEAQSRTVVLPALRRAAPPSAAHTGPRFAWRPRGPWSSAAVALLGLAAALLCVLLLVPRERPQEPASPPPLTPAPTARPSGPLPAPAQPVPVPDKPAPHTSVPVPDPPVHKD
ncbi:hypothetical protein KQY30_16935 [Streptomyces sp. GMY02]|uniref:hypothetical protein n=1 Tax=Streptomyces sp. GMY02 TaxID=1333528 RepID=UPI001C2B8997|nr:hypothetical protein [Streptomyces sp. GMY02]QXE35694.1 hypothetical protein KQY30_16935 [Streptomyces sp. GMY02]